ncbi:hypothetical protein ACJJIF_18370 [Microbulbifer sp. SSSA002]
MNNSSKNKTDMGKELNGAMGRAGQKEPHFINNTKKTAIKRNAEQT